MKALLLNLNARHTAISVFCSGIILLISLSINAQPAINPNITNLQQQPQNLVQIPAEILNMQQVTVPRLVGRQYNFDEVVTILDRVGLQIGEVVPVGNNDSAGIITNQQPAAGQRVFPQSRVNISYGIVIPAELVTVPDYTGLPVAQAESRMPNDRLDIGNIREDYSSAPAGVIISQFPEPGMDVDPGTPVSFVISLGEPPQPVVEVPSIIGESLRNAAAILREFGLTVGELIEETTNERAGIVLEQSPAPGTPVDRNTPVNIVYSVPGSLIIVPDVRNLQRNTAIEILKETGLNYHVQYQKNNDVAENTVVNQDPLPGNTVPSGTNVLLLISEKSIENWIFWAAGVLVAALLGAFTGMRIKTGKKKNSVGKMDINIDLTPKWDAGKQQILITGKNLNDTSLHFKAINDSGIQTIKTNNNEL